VNGFFLPYNNINSFNLMKKEFICVQPRSTVAKDRFDTRMNRLHSCRVDKREHGKVFLSSITNRYAFEMFEGGDDHWEVVK
tara:strand:+ start:798 stop:1040 length:243 start_codon:yes stop_codon:yes gene_type:complete